ncbi:MAG: hypothetical protein KAJ19_15280, partial [Gammaproteobacteria bacterium]|nr:hypothetical protein [Gammaproteobacteria bacterium]
QVAVEHHVARDWAAKLRKAAGQVKPTYSIEFEKSGVINVEEWASLTYLVFPSGDIDGVWIGHCLEVDIVSQGAVGGGPESALESTLEAAAIIIECDKREGVDPFERMAPENYWPPRRLGDWEKIRAKLGAQATWRGYDPVTKSFVNTNEDAAEDAEENDDDTE